MTRDLLIFISHLPCSYQTNILNKKKKIYGLISGIVMSPLIVDISPLYLSSSYPEMTLKFSPKRFQQQMENRRNNGKLIPLIHTNIHDCSFSCLSTVTVV
jgi:hypothetical protein